MTKSAKAKGRFLAFDPGAQPVYHADILVRIRKAFFGISTTAFRVFQFGGLFGVSPPSSFERAQRSRRSIAVIPLTPLAGASYYSTGEGSDFNPAGHSLCVTHLYLHYQHSYKNLMLLPLFFA